METSRVIVLILIFIILFASPDGGGGAGRDGQHAAMIAKEKKWLETLSNSTYGNINGLQGFDNNGTSAWWNAEGIEKVKSQVQDMVDEIVNMHRGQTLDGTNKDKAGGLMKRAVLPTKSQSSQPTPSANPVAPATMAATAAAAAGATTTQPARAHYQGRQREASEDKERILEELDRPNPNLVLHSQQLPLYHNITGVLDGMWNRVSITGLASPTHNISLDRNITSFDGKLWMEIEEDQPESEWKELSGIAQFVRIVLQLRDGAGGNGAHFEMKGIHLVESGFIVGITSSESFPGVFALPHLMLSNATFQLTKPTMVKWLGALIKAHTESQAAFPPWLPIGEQYLTSPSRRCQYISYTQIHPMRTESWFLRAPVQGQDIRDQPVIDTIERELRHRTGEPLRVSPPKIAASMIVYSPNCGFVLSSAKAEGPKIEVLLQRISRVATVAILVKLAEIFFLIRQMRESSTPSTVSRIAFWTIGLMTMCDSLAVFIFSAAGVSLTRCFLPMVSAAFLSSALAFFEMKYLMNIYRVQRPERTRAQSNTPQTTPAANAGRSAIARQQAASPAPGNSSASQPATQPPPAAVTPEPGTLPQPVTAAPATVPDDNGRSDASTLASRFYFLLLVTIILGIQSTSWPPTLRYAFQHFFLFVFLSVWLPQIWRNCYRNCRKGLRWDFVIGASCCRLLPVLYFYGYEENILWNEVEWPVVYASMGWLWLQIFILLVQNFFGPRFLVPGNFLPPAYDYHPVLTLDDLEAAMPLQSVASPTSPTAERDRDKANTRSFDCVVCMHVVDIPIAPREGEAGDDTQRGVSSSMAGLLGQGPVLGRRAYMVTPCKHVFHSNCLEGWMRVKLHCPICRNPLPPI